ncbi:MAG: DUF547 domain-containing protein [Myxococcota bacterium]
MRWLWWFGVAGGCRESMSSTAPADKGAVPAWGKLLAQVVDERGFVDYDALEADRGPLDRYVAWMGNERAWPGKTTKDWHAQYLNTYNALVMYQVLERGRPASVLDVQGIVPKGGYKFFHGTQFPVGGEWLTLAEIENERVRWKEMDYRDHAAMNCASKSCPPLRAELYGGGKMEAQLDEQFHQWINDDERGVRIVDGQAQFSPIFDWFARDFEFFTAGISPCTLAASVTDDPAKQQALYDLASQGCPHGTFDYDWSLNDASP